MQTKSKKKETKKYNKCLLLLLVPVFFFSADLFMGKRARNESYTKLGIFYGASSLITFILSVLGLVWPVLLYALITHVIVWMLCVIHTLNNRQQYQQQVEWMLEDEKERSELVFQQTFRLNNRMWCFWNWIPLLGGLSTFYLGTRINNRKLQWFGALSTALVAGLYFYLTMQAQITSGLLAVVALIIAYCSICIHPLIAGFYYEEYLDAAADQWTEDIQEYHQMEKTSWRIKNSMWQVLTLIPAFGSLGLFWAGITRENGKVLFGASVLCISEVACLAVPSMIMANEALLQAQPIMEGVAAAINGLWIFVYALIIFTGAMIRQEMLRIRAIQEYRF